MTPEQQEYEEAVEIVAKELYGNWCEASEYDRKYYRGRARSILSLTWPSGQPMIGVLAQNQRPPHLISVSVTRNEVTFWAAGQEAMVDDGFRRVVHPALKQEAK